MSGPFLKGSMANQVKANFGLETFTSRFSTSNVNIVSPLLYTFRTFAMLDIPVLVRSLKSSNMSPISTWIGSASGEKNRMRCGVKGTSWGNNPVLNAVRKQPKNQHKKLNAQVAGYSENIRLTTRL